MMAWEIFWQALVIIALVLANGFFVAAEFAVVRVRSSQLRPMLRPGGDWRVPFALRATKHLDACLSATQFGITLASLGLGWFGEGYIHSWLHPLFAYIPEMTPSAERVVGFWIAFSLITFLHIVLGELAPKTMAIQRPRAISLWVSPPLIFFYYLFFPAIWLLNGAANRFLHFAGFAPASESEHVIAPDELEYIFSRSRHAHPGDALINKIMLRSLRLRDVVASQIMLPRSKVVVLWKERSFSENIHIAQTAGHSRFPVCGEDLDDVVGMVLVKEWLWQIQVLGPGAAFTPIIRPVLTFTSRTPLPSMVELFRSSRSHLAVVLDDAGGTAGIVTFEDVLEEIVGEIRDELDIEKGPIFEQSEHSILVDATMSVREVRAETGWSFEFLPRETVAQWIERAAGHRPLKGESISTGELVAVAADTHSGGVRRVRISRLTQHELEAIEAEALQNLRTKE
jgi:CBS domain containing-hemolysin-like protein